MISYLDPHFWKSLMGGVMLLSSFFAVSSGSARGTPCGGKKGDSVAVEILSQPEIRIPQDRCLQGRRGIYALSHLRKPITRLIFFPGTLTGSSFLVSGSPGALENLLLLLVVIFLLVSGVFYFVKYWNKTARKSKRSSREESQRSSALLLAAPEAILTVDARGIIRSFNAVSERLFGYAQEEVLGKSIAILIPSSLLISQGGKISKYLALNRRHLIGGPREVWGRHKNGSLLSLEVSIGQTWVGSERRFIGSVRETKRQPDQQPTLLQPSLQNQAYNALKERAPGAISASLEEKRFRMIFHEAGIGMVITDPRGKFLQANPSFCEMLGYTEEELTQLTFRDLTYPEDLEMSVQRFQQFLASVKIRYQHERRYRRKDGSLLWGRLTISLMRGEQGEPKFVIGMVEDITEHKQAVENLEEREAWFRAIFQEAGIGIVLTDPEGKFLQANRSFREMMGYTERKLKAMAFREITCEEDLQTSVDRFRDFLASGKNRYQDERRYRRKDGSFLWGRLTVSLLRDEKGNPKMTIGMLEDITERKRFQEELHASKEQFELAVRGSSDGIWDWNVLTNEVYYSPRFKELLGYEDPEMQNVFASFEARLHPDDYAYTMKALKNHLETRAPFDIEYRLRTRSQGYRWFRGRGQAVWDETGKATRMAGSITDITDQRWVEEELLRAKENAEASERIKAEFLSHAIQRIQAPLGRIVEQVESLKKRLPYDEDKEFAQDVLTQAGNLLGLSRDLLDLSNLEAERVELEQVDFNLLLTVETVLQMLGPTAHKKGLELIYLVRPDTPLNLRGDPVRIRQILFALTQNAIKFTDQGEVDIRVSVEEETEFHVTVRFSVRDTGAGISKNYEKHLLKSFKQAHLPKIHPRSGDRLGLTIANKLAELMGGEIHFTTEEGTGSTFWFSIAFEKQTTTFRYASQSAKRPFYGKWALVVDDNQTAREALEVQLESLGFTVVLAPNAEEALRLLRGPARIQRFDVMLIDLMMPGMDGVTFCQEIQKDPRTAKIPWCLLTSRVQKQEIERLSVLDKPPYYLKPIKQSHLARRLFTLMSNSEDNVSTPFRPQDQPEQGSA